MIRRLIVVFLTVTVLCLTTELVMRGLPISSRTETGYYFDPFILTYPPNFEWQVATGWDLRNPQILRSNNLGFAAHREFVPNSKALALIGDSFVEASMLAERDRPAVQLEIELFDQRPVYGMGSPGTSLLDYAERIRFAYHHLALREFVLFVEGGDLRQSVCGSGAVHSPCLDPATLAPRREQRNAPSALKRILRHSAVAQYLTSQLKLNIGDLASLFNLKDPKSNVAATPEKVTGPSRDVIAKKVVDEFYAKLDPIIGDIRLVFVVDGRRGDRSKRALDSDEAERQWFMQTVQIRGARAIDLETVYDGHYRASRLSLIVGPYDEHLNAQGVRLAMKAVAEAIR